jgi:hypothetical protein
MKRLVLDQRELPTGAEEPFGKFDAQLGGVLELGDRLGNLGW